MNNKLAKSLRRVAQLKTVGKPPVTYQFHPMNDTQIVLGDCTRRVYKHYKKGVTVPAIKLALRSIGGQKNVNG